MKIRNMYNIVFSINNSYAPYLYVCLKSLLAHIQSKDKYQVYVLESEVSEADKKQILSLQCDNLGVEFIDVRQFIDKNITKIFSVTEHFTPETYYRFFLPRIFPKLDKVLYLDADTIIMRDIAPMFSIDIGSNYLGVTHDCEIVRMSNLDDTEYSDYFIKTLGVKIENYFQAGVMLVNLEKMRQDNITEKLLSALIKIGTPKFVDQDILNMVCQNNVQFISQNWNYTWHLQLCDKSYQKNLPKVLNAQYKAAKDNPYIIHFTGNKIKPVNYPGLAEAKLFWMYAKDTPYYEYFKILLNESIEVNKKKLQVLKNKIKKYKLLNFLTLGLLSKKYNHKIKHKEQTINLILANINFSEN